MMKILFYIFSLFIYSTITFGEYYEVQIETPSNSIQGTDIKENSLSLDRIMTKGAEDSDVLLFNGEEWTATPMPSLVFRGTWNPKINVDPQIDFNGNTFIKNGQLFSAIRGDYFIVSTSNEDSTWLKNDWIIFNGVKWDRINNTGSVLSIFGRKNNVVPRDGDYSWKNIDKTQSSIFDFSDVEKPNGDLADYENNLLKWNKIDKVWRLEEDLAGDIKAPISADKIGDSEIKDEDISPNAGISLNKVSGLDTINKLPYSGGEINNLNFNNNNLKVGSASNIVLKTQDNLEKKFKFDDLKLLFEEIISLFFIKQKKLQTDSLTADPYLSENIDANFNYSWGRFDLDIATETLSRKFQTNDNVLNSTLSGYDNTKFTLPVQIGEKDSIKSAIEKLEIQLNQTNVGVVLKTPMINDKTIDPTMHFKNLGSSGFLLLDGSNPKKWRIENTSGIQFKGEINHSEISTLPIAGAFSGDYYILKSKGSITSAATTSTLDWNIGDWAIFDGSKYLKINNTGLVSSFNQRTGEVVSCPNENCPDIYDYDWSMLDKSESKLGDIGDVISPNNSDIGKVLKRVNGNWVAQNELKGVVEGVEVPITSIADGSIEDGHLIDIEKNQVASSFGEKSLLEDLELLYDQSGGELSGSIDFTKIYSLLNVSTINFGTDSIFNMGEAIDFVYNMENELNKKQNKLPVGLSTEILISNDSKFEFRNLNTESVVEGSKNKYFSEDRVRNAIGFPLPENATATNEDIVFGGQNPDNLKTAIEKIYKKMESFTNPSENSLNSNSIQNGTIPISALAKANSQGQTIMYLNDQWEYRSISGLSFKGEVDLEIEQLSTIGLNDGDYYIIKKAGEINGITYHVGDWAVYYFNSEIDNGFTQISKTQGIQSFNDRIGIIETCPNTNCPNIYDYSWEMINREHSPLIKFNDIVDYSVYTDNENNMLLKWNSTNNKWEAAPDLEGTSGNNLTIDKFTNSTMPVKSISNDDIESVKFEHVNGLKAQFDGFVNLKPNNLDPVIFKNDLKFETNPKYSITGIGNILSSDGTHLFKFDDLGNKCNLLDLNKFEIFTDESITNDGKRKLINAERKFVEFTKDYWTGSTAGLFYDADKIRSLVLTGFSIDNLNFNQKIIGETTFLEMFNKLAGKVDAFLANTAGSDRPISNNGVIEIDDDSNGKMIFVENADIKIKDLENISPDFEVTLKRADPLNSDPRNYKVRISLESGKTIEGNNIINLSDNYASITIKYIQEGNNEPEFVILRRSGNVN